MLGRRSQRRGIDSVLAGEEMMLPIIAALREAVVL